MYTCVVFYAPFPPIYFFVFFFGGMGRVLLAREWFFVKKQKKQMRERKAEFSVILMGTYQRVMGMSRYYCIYVL